MGKLYIAGDMEGMELEKLSHNQKSWSRGMDIW